MKSVPSPSPVYAEPKLIHVFALDHQRFSTFCRLLDEPPYEGPVEYRYAGEDVWGYRYYPWNVIKLCHMWTHPHYDDIRDYVYGSSFGKVDLYHFPTTWT